MYIYTLCTHIICTYIINIHIDTVPLMKHKSMNYACKLVDMFVCMCMFASVCASILSIQWHRHKLDTNGHITYTHNVQTQTKTLRQTHRHTHTHLHTHTHTNTHIYTHIHTHAYTYTHIHTYIHTYTRIHTCTHLHTPTYTHTHTYTYTHTIYIYYIKLIIIFWLTFPILQRVPLTYKFT